MGAPASSSRTATEYWRESFLGGEVLVRSDDLVLASNAELPDRRRLMTLRTVDGTLHVVLSPALADRLGLTAEPQLTESIFRRRLAEAGVSLHEPDHLFYFRDADKDALLHEDPAPGVRRLTDGDADAFAEFRSGVSAEDLDAAYVELDHWAVFGAFEHGRLVCAASAYPWGGGPLADIGVVTSPASRGRGSGRRVVRAISRYASNRGYEPQYRCQLDNQASITLAGAAGFSPFGTWEVVSPDATP